MTNIRRVLVFILISLLLLATSCRTESDRQVRAARESSAKVWKEQPLGSFAVTSGELCASDPSYGPPVAGESAEIHGLVHGAKRGTWQASVTRVDTGNDDVRCAELVAHHAEHPPRPEDEWSPEPELLGVDSGQAGVFESETMGQDSVIPEGYFGTEGPLVPEELWYSMCCKQTLSATGAGVVPGGAVSSAGFGDGAYSWFTRKAADGQVVGVRIVFLEEADLEN